MTRPYTNCRKVTKTKFQPAKRAPEVHFKTTKSQDNHQHLQPLAIIITSCNNQKPQMMSEDVEQLGINNVVSKKRRM
jgi:hypothetical protein